MTAASTQPPDTEPTKAPLSQMAMWLPGPRGADPHVESTVAKATPWPSSSQSAACRSTPVASVPIAAQLRPDVAEATPTSPHAEIPEPPHRGPLRALRPRRGYGILE
jgi:hypothetical protein